MCICSCGWKIQKSYHCDLGKVWRHIRLIKSRFCFFCKSVTAIAQRMPGLSECQGLSSRWRNLTCSETAFPIWFTQERQFQARCFGKCFMFLGSRKYPTGEHWETMQTLSCTTYSNSRISNFDFLRGRVALKVGLHRKIFRRTQCSHTNDHAGSDQSGQLSLLMLLREVGRRSRGGNRSE